MGVPIEGEAGISYLLRKSSDIPPLMLKDDERKALVVGIRFERIYGGHRLSVSTHTTISMIKAVHPSDLRQRADQTSIFAPLWQDCFQRDFTDALNQVPTA